MDFLLSDAETVLVVDRATLNKLQSQIASCGKCNAATSDIVIEMVLDEITGSNPASTSYFLGELVVCPTCKKSIREGELIEWKEMTG